MATKAVEFKKFIAAKKKSYFSKIKGKRKDTKASNPRGYWKMLNDSVKAKPSENTVSLEDLKDHFQRQAESAKEDHGCDFNNPKPNNPCNEFISQAFSFVGVKTQIHRLKNNMAKGIDKIC